TASVALKSAQADEVDVGELGIDGIDGIDGTESLGGDAEGRGRTEHSGRKDEF
ncbi:hypothetical protein THAOC_18159, partial [Thalassiosira oceanica]